MKPTRLKRLILGYLWQVKGKLSIAFLCAMGVALAQILAPWPFKLIFDHILLDRALPPSQIFLESLFAGGKVSALVALSLGVVAIAVVRGLFSYSQLYVTSALGLSLVHRLRRDFFVHLQRLSISFHNRNRSGELLTKLTNDTNVLKDVFTESGLVLAAHVLTLIGMFAMMFALDWKLSLIVFATFPLLLWILSRLYRNVKKSARRQRRQEGKTISRVSELLRAVIQVQALGGEKHEEERFTSETARTLEESIRNARREGSATRTIEVVTAVGTWVVILYGSLQVIDGRMAPGDILLFVSYVGTMYKPIRNLTKFSMKFSRARVSAERIAEILETEPEIQDSANAVEARELHGEIVFDHVTFGYEDGKSILKDLSFRIGAGQTVALVGASGAGKSTIVSLIMRFYDPQEGSVLVDGVNVKNYQYRSLRREIGVVLQDSVLFGATILENISYGKPDATPAEIEAAAKAANAHDFISELPSGYDSEIGERGCTLSGGQQQRIAIARAIIRNSPILILDEPMTGLDVESEAAVRDALKRLMAGRSCLIITHDLQSASEADWILVLDEGRIVEQGRHADLIAGSSRYRRVHELKNGGQTSGEAASLAL